MSLVLSSSFMAPCFNVNHVNVPHIVIPQISLVDPGYCSHYNIPRKHFFANKRISMSLKHISPSEFMARASMKTGHDLIDDESHVEENWRDQEDVGVDDMESPWEGAILYQRNPTISHLEYCTTLERLGLGDLSTEVSKAHASLMGLRVTKSVKDFPHGTPVLISIDVTRKKRKLRLDGIIRTVLTLVCNRCGAPAAESVFSNFSLLLTEDPVEEPEAMDMGVIYGQDESKGPSNWEEEDDDASIDFEDRLYFPSDENVIDISKNVRDMVHLEITLNAVCDPQCKGFCFGCGENLNTSSCTCNQNVKQKANGPLAASLKKQMLKQRA